MFRRGGGLFTMLTFKLLAVTGARLVTPVVLGITAVGLLLAVVFRAVGLGLGSRFLEDSIIWSKLMFSFASAILKHSIHETIGDTTNQRTQCRCFVDKQGCGRPKYCKGSNSTACNTMLVFRLTHVVSRRTGGAVVKRVTLKVATKLSSGIVFETEQSGTVSVSKVRIAFGGCDG
jgi:hypothetical protein